jgi:hypothetical protein
MRFAFRQRLRQRRVLPVTLWLLLLLAANALQVVAATHWHSNAMAVPRRPPRIPMGSTTMAVCSARWPPMSGLRRRPLHPGRFSPSSNPPLRRCRTFLLPRRG